MSESFYIAVDVGTSSVRAALVTSEGRVVSSASRPLQIWQPSPDYYEQSSEDIWNKACLAVKEVAETFHAENAVRKIKGIGFDATCSLVALNSSGDPVTVSPSREACRNVILWLDHRAIDQAKRINDTHHQVLSYVGGAISPEMAAPKLLWLKEHLRDCCWEKCDLFLDLPEFLTYRATKDPARSMCSVVCKVNYMVHESWSSEGTNSSDRGWIDSYWTGIGLQDLVNTNYSKFGVKVNRPGEPVGDGLTKQAAIEMGLWQGLPVGTSLIDAHAGGLGVIGADLSELLGDNVPITSRLAVICGTSSCHMVVNQEPIFVEGVWGPYYSAMVPGLWLSEGGQSVTGKLVDHIIDTHAAYRELTELTQTSGLSVYDQLNNHLSELAERRKVDNVAFLTQDYHVLPDFHGNRSPMADATMTGMICGLTLSADLDSLALLYLATIQALAHGTRHIIESMNKAGHAIDVLCMCGGLTKNLLYIQAHADVTGLPCVLSRESESVLVGSAVLGACASGDFPSVQDAMMAMNVAGKVIRPQENLKRFYEKKHQVFLTMLKNQMEYRDIMKR